MATCGSSESQPNSTREYPDQEFAFPAVAGMCGRYSPQEGGNYLRDLGPQEQVLRQGYQVESRRPLRGVCRRLGMPRPELDIDLNAGDPSHQGWAPGLGLRTQGWMVNGSGPMKKYRWDLCIPTVAVYPSGP